MPYTDKDDFKIIGEPAFSGSDPTTFEAVLRYDPTTFPKGNHHTYSSLHWARFAG